ncbi:acyl-CoA synthetase (AMP-forming)/AMP-acid ligase II [Slackia heliotrinireducens DSM 20476]|uniref:Acyl-CoA synthetase (AMP-forming)/AMP-acid ligase II n=1 Tax=Slackia heliotrinireducens (strain ATCC 29202 / DSM 20476 / NCTC 11029 / RHS 1) TaxID=471855 RepID=C7N2V3_SLAHD|nr:acyl-CoA synthetase (AMP-forming)/AMP-acid ligase II [Slackia heliotrinireducens DSM 20476]
MLTFVDAAGGEVAYTERRAQAAVARAFRRLRPLLTQDGIAVAVDLPNCPKVIWVLLACAQMERPVVMLNHRLTPAEKEHRLAQLEGKLAVAATVDARWLAGDGEGTGGALPADDEPASSNDATQSNAAEKPGPIDGGAPDALAPAPYALVEDLAHSQSAVIMFTSGTTGIPKAAVLTWENIMASAQASLAPLGCTSQGSWQAALPLCHIGGLQAVIRGFLSHCPVVLYEHFDAARMLADAKRFGATHLSVVDKTLRDLIDEDARAGEGALAQYRCLLLGGAAINPATIEAAKRAHARVFASYGMTETSSQVAHHLVDDTFDGGLDLMPHVEAAILNPDEHGIGQLALRGPSIVSAYLNAKLPASEQGFFLTGDRARIEDGRLYVAERLDDLFISGGENVYPAEVERCICQVEGVTACHVFGMADSVWGRRPAAVVASPMEPSLIQQRVQVHVREHLARISRPDTIVVVRQLPQTGIGKVDRKAARTLVERSLAEKPADDRS